MRTQKVWQFRSKRSTPQKRDKTHSLTPKPGSISWLHQKNFLKVFTKSDFFKSYEKVWQFRSKKSTPQKRDKTHSLTPKPGRISWLHQNFDSKFWTQKQLCQEESIFLSKTHSLTFKPGRISWLHQKVKNSVRKKVPKKCLFRGQKRASITIAIFWTKPTS
jgi:hypothetical protein